MIVASLPAWWRFAQCMRRYYDTHDTNPHLINAGKYSTSFFVAIFSAVTSAVIGMYMYVYEHMHIRICEHCSYARFCVICICYIMLTMNPGI